MIWLVAAIVIAVFALGAIVGAPYLPTRRSDIQTALELLDLRAGQTVIDLGSGDGAFLVAAAKEGIRGIGYEINPLLYLISKLRTLSRRKLITIKLKNYWRVSLPAADGIYVFLIGRYMRKLNAKLSEELRQPTKLVSYTFLIPGRQSETKRNGLYLYRYP